MPQPTELDLLLDLFQRLTHLLDFVRGTLAEKFIRRATEKNLALLNLILAANTLTPV